MVIKMVKKGILIGIIPCIIVGIIFILMNNKDETRIRILSNSNLEIDQQEKQIVKEELAKIFQESNNLNCLEIEKRLIENTKGKINHNIKVTFEKSYYEAKSYNNEFIPSGVYNTILITIGEGKGSNFWTLLYPEYYNISFEDNNEIEYRLYIIDLCKKIINLFSSI